MVIDCVMRKQHKIMSSDCSRCLTGDFFHSNLNGILNGTSENDNTCCMKKLFSDISPANVIHYVFVFYPFQGKDTGE